MAKQTPEDIFREHNKTIRREVFFHPFLCVVMDGNNEPVSVHWDFMDTLEENNHLSEPFGKNPALSVDDADALMRAASEWVDDQYDRIEGSESKHAMRIHPNLMGGPVEVD